MFFQRSSNICVNNSVINVNVIKLGTQWNDVRTASWNITVLSIHFHVDLSVCITASPWERCDNYLKAVLSVLPVLLDMYKWWSIWHLLLAASRTSQGYGQGIVRRRIAHHALLSSFFGNYSPAFPSPASVLQYWHSERNVANTTSKTPSTALPRSLIGTSALPSRVTAPQMMR